MNEKKTDVLLYIILAIAILVFLYINVFSRGNERGHTNFHGIQGVTVDHGEALECSCGGNERTIEGLSYLGETEASVTLGVNINAASIKATERSGTNTNAAGKKATERSGANTNAAGKKATEQSGANTNAVGTKTIERIRASTKAAGTKMTEPMPEDALTTDVRQTDKKDADVNMTDSQEAVIEAIDNKAADTKMVYSQTNRKPNGESNDESNGESNGKPNGKPNGKANDEPNRKPNGKPNDESNDESNGKPNGKANDEPNDKAIGKPNDQPNAKVENENASSAFFEEEIEEKAHKISPVGYHLYVDLDNLLMYVYKDGEPVKTYEVSGGKPSSPSPIGTWRIISKDTWGEGFGGAWLGFNVPWGKYGIHGTNEPWSIGRSNVSKGCIRMRNSDAKELFKLVPYNTLVTIVYDNIPFYPMRDGDVGSDVLAMERALKKLGYYNGGEDGVFGSSLKSAVMKFQKDNKLYGTGVINNSTYEKILMLEKEYDERHKQLKKEQEEERRRLELELE